MKYYWQKKFHEILLHFVRGRLFPPRNTINWKRKTQVRRQSGFCEFYHNQSTPAEPRKYGLTCIKKPRKAIVEATVLCVTAICRLRDVHCESERKQDTLLMSIPSWNIDRFSKFFHCYISIKLAPKWALYIPPYIENVTALPCETISIIA